MKRNYMQKGLSVFLLIVAICRLQAQPAYSSLIVPDESGRIVYKPYTDQGDILPDFSHCGYMGGGVDFPEVPVVLTLEPEPTGDDTRRIQAAIDKIGKMKASKSGIRGALLLKKGTYRLASTLKLDASGVVLRGEGDDQEGTVLLGTAPRQYTLIQIGSNDKAELDVDSKQPVIDDYVPSGTRVFTLEDASEYKKGDAVIIERTPTAEWISALKMDRIAPLWVSTQKLSAEKIKEYQAKGLLSADGKKYNATQQWIPHARKLHWERKITAIEGNRITVDIPITNALQWEYGGGTVYKYKYKKRAKQVGLENLRAEVVYDERITADVPYLKGYAADEKHAWTFLSIATSEDVWVNKVSCTGFCFGMQSQAGSRRLTIADCRVLDPVCKIEGGRRYGFVFTGQQGLVRNCFTRNARHDFMLHANVPGPNAFVDCTGEQGHAASEPHHRWATGCLWDNCQVSGNSSYFSISNRGNFGSGHGWAGAQMVLWNCRTALAVVMAPPTAQNFAIGVQLLEQTMMDDEYIKDRVNMLNEVSGNTFDHTTGQPVVGDAFIEHQNKAVWPRSLYEKQLEDRIGKGMKP